MEEKNDVDGISHEEMDTMLKTLSEAGLDDEPEADDVFEASGGIVEEPSQPKNKGLVGEITRVKVARRMNETIQQLLTEDFEVEEAEIKIHLGIVGLDKPIDVFLEF